MNLDVVLERQSDMVPKPYKGALLYAYIWATFHLSPYVALGKCLETQSEDI